MRIKVPTIQKRKIRLEKVHFSRVSLWDAWMMCVAFFFVIPDGLININENLYTVIYVYGLYFAYFNAVIMFAFYMYERRHVSRHFIYFIIFFVGTLFILIKEGSSLNGWKNAFSAGLFIVILAEANQKRIDKLVLTFLTILEGWIYLNLFLMLINPNGMYYLETNHSYMNWILGYKSSLQYYILPAICFSWINARYRGEKVRYLLLATVSVIEALIANNIMLILALAALLTFQFSRLWKIEKMFNIWIYYAIDLAINILLIFFVNIISNIPLVDNMLRYFGKNLTLTYRVSVIWPKTLQLIQDHLLFGNGFFTVKERVAQYGGNLGFIHSHNELLEIFFIGGIFLFLLFAFIHICIGKKLYINKNTDLSKVLSVSIFILYIMMSVEVYNRIVGGSIWLILYLAGECDSLHNKLTSNYRQ